MLQEQAVHIDELARVAVGQHTARDGIIHDSWLRCVEQYRLDPAVSHGVRIVTQSRLREHRDAMGGLLHCARSRLETLYSQVSGLEYVLLLTDAQGVTVDYIGNERSGDRDGRELRKAGLYPGADWDEAHMGTCAVGTCIATRSALIVHRSDHFDAGRIGLTCTAAPVHDTDGSLAAVLDISALHSPPSKQSQHVALQLVKFFARSIENAHLLERFRDEWIIGLSTMPGGAEGDPDMVLAVDRSGHILGCNDRARRLLAPRMPGAGKGGPIGQRFDAFFDCEPGDLPSFTAALPAHRRRLRLHGSEGMLHVRAMAPAVPASRAVRADDRALPPALRALFGEDRAMRAVATRASRLADTGMSLLIHGETGTGKEHLAKAIHAASDRASGPFIALNCAAIPESLIESELFGHEPGAFTGASPRGRKGLFVAADGGTLFLDEIGDMPLALQARLLRVLAEREVTPVGRNRPVPVNIRVIAATHRDLTELVREGRFRGDLYYRLNAAVLTLPPLRQRADLGWLIDRLLAVRAPEGAGPRRISPEALGALLAHGWPGNVRELINCLDYASAVSSGGMIGTSDLPDTLAVPAPRHDLPVPDAFVAGEEDAMTGQLLGALRAWRWNVSAVARDLGVDRTTIHRRMRRLGIVPPHKRG